MRVKNEKSELSYNKDGDMQQTFSLYPTIKNEHIHDSSIQQQLAKAPFLNLFQ